MNLQEQIGALDAGVDQLLQAAATRAARNAEAAPAEPPAADHTATNGTAHAVPPHAHATSRAAATAPEHVVTQAAAAVEAATQAVHAAEAAAAADVAAAIAAPAEAAPEPDAADAADVQVDAPEPVESAEASAQANAAAQSGPTMQIARPSQNEITITINGQTVTLHPLQVGQMIEELSNARASMQPEPPPGIPSGWRFVTTKNPVMAVQKQSNGDRTLVLRHTGHGWVPFTFSPDMVIQMYMMLTQR